MAYTAGNLSLVGYASTHKVYAYDAGTDGLATVIASGYFNNTDDQLSLAAGDTILVNANDTTATIKVSSVSTGTVSTAVADSNVGVETGTTATNLVATGLTVLSTTASKTFTLDAPYKGARKFLFATTGSSLITHTVASGSSLVTFNGTNTNALLNANGECLELVGLSTTRWAITTNSGTVAFS